MPAEAKNVIARLRTALGITQQEFAQRAGISYASVQNYEQGRSPSAETAVKLVNLAVENGLAELAMELEQQPYFIRAVFAPSSARSRLPADPRNVHLADSLHVSLDRVLASGNADSIGALEEFLISGTGTESRIGAGEKFQIGDSIPESPAMPLTDPERKFLSECLRIYRSPFSGALKENVAIFGVGLDAVETLARIGTGDERNGVDDAGALSARERRASALADHAENESHQLKKATDDVVAELRRARAADTGSGARTAPRGKSSPRKAGGRS